MESPNFIEYILEIGLQWMYVTRKKSSIVKFIITLLISLIFIIGLALVLFIFEAIVISNKLFLMQPNFIRILAIIVCALLIIVFINSGVQFEDYSKILLSHLYLRNKNRNEKLRLSTWKKIILISATLLMIKLLWDELFNFIPFLGLTLTEEITIVIVVMVLAIYLPLTEGIINKVKYYNFQYISSIGLFFISFFLFNYSLNTYSEYSVETVTATFIFAIGQIAFAVSAITNYKNKYSELLTKYNVELENYLYKADYEYQ